MATTFPISPLIPGGYSTVDASALMASEGSAQRRTGAVIGEAALGATGTAHLFTSPKALQGVLRSGPAYDAARFMFLGGASRVIVVRAGSTTEADADLAGTGGSPLTLTAKLSGAEGNEVKYEIDADNRVSLTYTDKWTGAGVAEVFEGGPDATPQHLADLINGKVSGVRASTLVSAQIKRTGNAPDAPVDGALPLTTTTAAESLTGGDDGDAPGTADFADALSVLESEDVDIIVAATGRADIQASVIQHCNIMSTPAVRRERTTVAGPALGTKPAEVIAQAGALNSSRAQIVFPGASNFDADGALKQWDAYYVAAFTAGRHLSVPDPATSLTSATFDWPDIELRLSAVPGGDQEKLLEAGVTPIAPMPSAGFQYVDSLSTYKTDQSFRDFHKVRTADESAKRLRNRLATKFNGRKTTAGLRETIRNEAVAELRDQVTEGLLVQARPPEVLADPDNNRATLVNAAVLLPDTQKYILLTLSLQPPSTQGVGDIL